MVRVLVAGILALLISILAGPKFIDFLRRNEFGQHIREEGPKHHATKQGTPTMGGLLIVLAASLAFLATSDYTLPALTVFGTALAGGAIGVNLTDGLDGLAAGTSIIALFTFTAMAVTIYIRSGTPGHRIETRLDAAFIGAAIIGAAIGFLWFNAFPAEVFMGDTGSMAMGGAIGAMAIFLKVELLLLLVGGIFVIEALSVMLQVVSFKYWGRRIFLMAPLHHHFEMKAWSETKIMVRFWIVTGLLCAAGFALYYRYFRGFR